MVVADQPAKLYTLLQIECPAWTGGRQPAQQCHHPKQEWEVAKTIWFGHCATMTPQVLLGASLLRISHFGITKFANWLPPKFTSMFAIRMGRICRVPAESPGQPCRVVPPNPNINQNRSKLICPVYHCARHNSLHRGLLGPAAGSRQILGAEPGSCRLCAVELRETSASCPGSCRQLP